MSQRNIPTEVPISAPLTVVHLIANLKIGGAQIVLERLVTASSRRNFRHIVVSMRDLGVIGVRLRGSGVEVHVLEMSHPWRYGLALVRLFLLLREVRPDILQTWLYPADIMGFLAGRWLVPRVYWNVRCSLQEARGKLDQLYWLPRLLGRLSGRVEGVVVNSREGERDHILLGYAPKEWHFIPNGVDTERFKADPVVRMAWRKRLALPDDGVVFGLLARNHAMKGQSVFIEAAGQLARDHAKVYFVMAGRQVEETDKKFAPLLAASGCREIFFLLGEIAEVNELMAALDVLVVPSLWGEGFSNTLAEGMACQLSCVVSRCGDAAEMAPPGTPLVATGDPQALRHAMAEVVAMGKEGREALGMAGRQRLLQHYSLSRMIDQYETLYGKG